VSDGRHFWATPETWKLIELVAAARTRRGREEVGHDFCTDQYVQNLLGSFGEATYSAFSGLPWNTRTFHDGGMDFPGVDVKGSSHYAEPWLLRHVDFEVRLDVRYVCVGCDLATHRSWVAGQATGEMLLAAPIRDHGQGPTRTLLTNELLPI
jgi:hypothetical protein